MSADATVDLRALRSADPAEAGRARRALVAACRRDGHVLLVGHDLGAAVDAAYAQSAAFHRLPDEVKAPLHNERHGGRGWVPLLTEPAYVPGTVARCESFDLARENPPEGGARGVTIGPNPWPSPEVLPSFRPTVYGLYLELRTVATVLFEAFAAGLGLAPGALRDLDTDRSPSLMRLLHYPGRGTGGRSAATTDPGPAVVGISAHTDFEAFTFMHQLGPGLQLRRPDGTWIDAPAGGEGITIVVGDMLERLTNGFLRATPHRVPDTPWARSSLILFCALDRDAVIEPLAPFVSDRRPARYEPVTQAAHIAAAVATAVENRDRLDPGTSATGYPADLVDPRP